MLTTINKLAAVIDTISDLMGRTIAWLTLLMVLVTCGVVAARYVFSFGSIALQESVMYMHATVFMLGVAFTLKEQGHVRVDVFYERFPPKVKVLVDIAGHLFFLIPVSLFILWTSYDYVSFSWSLKEASGQPGGLPGVFLVKTLIPIMSLALLLQGLAEILRGINTLVKKTA